MAKEVNDNENEVIKESAKKESTKKESVKKDSSKKDSTKKAASKKDAAKKETKKSFFKEFKAELKRVSWPTPKQLINNTVAVISIVLIVCAIVFVLDVIFEGINTYGVDKLKALVTSSSSETVEDQEEHDHEEVEGENTEVSNEAETTEDAQNQTTNSAEATTNTVEETTTEQ